VVGYKKRSENPCVKRSFSGMIQGTTVAGQVDIVGASVKLGAKGGKSPPPARARTYAIGVRRPNTILGNTDTLAGKEPRGVDSGKNQLPVKRQN